MDKLSGQGGGIESSFKFHTVKMLRQLNIPEYC
jgi:hypothetical protein